MEKLRHGSHGHLIPTQQLGREGRGEHVTYNQGHGARMMDSDFPLRLPVEIQSPIEFVLVGPFGTERGVLVQSSDASIDLVAHAQKERDDEPTPRRISWLSRQARPIVVSSPSVHPDLVSRETDHRQSELTLVWRGESGAIALDRRFRPRIQSCLATHGADLVNALYEGSTSRVIWALAEVVDMCREHEAEKHRRSLIRNGVTVAGHCSLFCGGTRRAASTRLVGGIRSRARGFRL